MPDDTKEVTISSTSVAEPAAKPAASAEPRRRSIFRRRGAESADGAGAGPDEDAELEGTDAEMGMVEYLAKQKPVLSAEQQQMMRLRKEIKDRKPVFRRQEGFRYKRLETGYRRPKGITSKMRKGLKYRTPKAKVGYGGPKGVRGLHPSGFQEVLVFTVKDLRKINPKTQAARIGHGVGTRKRLEIIEEAENKSIRVLNRGY